MAFLIKKKTEQTKTGNGNWAAREPDAFGFITRTEGCADNSDGQMQVGWEVIGRAPTEARSDEFSVRPARWVFFCVSVFQSLANR